MRNVVDGCSRPRRPCRAAPPRPVRRTMPLAVDHHRGCATSAGGGPPLYAAVLPVLHCCRRWMRTSAATAVAAAVPAVCGAAARLRRYMPPAVDDRGSATSSATAVAAAVPAWRWFTALCRRRWMRNFGVRRSAALCCRRRMRNVGGGRRRCGRPCRAEGQRRNGISITPAKPPLIACCSLAILFLIKNI